MPVIVRDYISWWARPAFLRAWGRPAPSLWAGPWLGEFGWELLNWQGFLRWLAPRYEEVVVICRPGMEALYADFATRFEHHRVRGVAECNRARRVDNPDELSRVLRMVPRAANHVPTVGWQPDARKRFVRFGARGAQAPVDVLFHARGRDLGSDRNWNADKWGELVARLVGRGLSVACTGLRGATQDVAGEHRDLRDRPLAETMDVMANARLVIGPSSGPMHLASLCGAPHLVWTDGAKYARGRTNRDKYERWWNPHRTPVRVLEDGGFDPTVETVDRAVMAALDELAR